MANFTFDDALLVVIDSFRGALTNGLDASMLVITYNSVTIQDSERMVLAEGGRDIRKLIESHETSPLDSFWLVRHNADLTETGATQKQSYIKTTWKGFEAQRSHEREIVEEFCRERFGPKVAYVQGVAPCASWCVVDCTAEDYRKANPVRWGGMETETHRITLDIGNHGKTIVTSDEIV